MIRDELLPVVEAWHSPADGEATKSRDLILHILQWSEAPFTRHQFAPGHITATGLVWNPSRDKVALVHHKRLHRWLLPGGHVEAEDISIWDAAAREAVEETSLILDSNHVPFVAGLDVHGIPSNGKEPYHLHHDVIVCFRAVSEEFAVSEESHSVAWCGIQEMDRYELAGSIQRSVQRSWGKLWNRNWKNFENS